jgi:glycosyltransferase involved in cell wall biosynthesis
MRIVLLQDEIYLPSFAGGTKANRCLLEGLAHGGHLCLALTRALTSSPDGPNDALQFSEEMRSRGIKLRTDDPDVFSYEYHGVQVEAIDCPSTDASRDYVTRRIRAFRPDWVLVADDKRRFLLASAAAAAPGRVVPLLQTIMQLPFGPLSVHESQAQADLMRDTTAIIVISRYLQDYIRTHGGMKSHVLAMPVYGAGPFQNLARFDTGFVTMINPCELKGLAIFLALARAYPQVNFAAVPTWGANDEVLRKLREQPNVCLLEPADNIEEILTQTRILLVPSLWPETFGYVVPEAMLRGIPVLASDLGGLPEAKLGVDYLLPVTPAQRHGNNYVSPLQDTEPWSAALGELLRDADSYHRCSRKSREAALDFVSRAKVSSFEEMLTELAERLE